MGKGRLEAFSDGVLAIIITIMVLEMKVPHGDDPVALKPLFPVFISYILSLNRFLGWASCLGAGFGYEFRAAHHIAFGVFASWFAAVFIIYR